MPPHPTQVEPLKRVVKIVNAFLSRPDITPFQEPVDWRGLGLDDYPKIVKKMMDLGTVKRKLERKQYYTAAACAADIRLIWQNCMAYNADGSDFWLLAKAFQRRFEDRYRKIRQEFDCGEDLEPGDEGGPETTTSSTKSGTTSSKGGNNYSAKERSGASTPAPTTTSTTSAVSPSESLPLDIRTRFGANLFLLSGVELAHVIMKLEQECPHVLVHLTEEVDAAAEDETAITTTAAEKAISPKIEINVDAIESPLFEELSSYVLERVGNKGHSDAKGMDHVPSSSNRPKKKKKT